MRNLSLAVLSVALMAATGVAEARWLSVDPVKANAGNGQNFNRYNYANNNSYRFIDPDGRIAYQVGETVYIPVTFKGSGATPELVNSVVTAAGRLGTQDGTRIVVVPVDRAMGGVNVMNISPGARNPNTQFGEGVVSGPGIIRDSGAHLDSGRSDLAGATLHETLHFAHLSDRYNESPNSTFGNRGEATPMRGFEDSIMGSTSGTMLMKEETQQFQQANSLLKGEDEWKQLQQRINQDD